MRNLKLLSSRKAYEFAPDTLRLTLTSMKPVLEHIKNSFSFQMAALGTPIPTFGAIPATLPPGIAFNLGAIQSAEGTLVPIRFLHFEPARIVIDVAGPSAVCGGVYDALLHILEDLKASDGSPTIGEPQRILDASEFSFELDCASTAFIPVGIRGLAEELLRQQKHIAPEAQLVAALRLHLQMPDEAFPGSAPNPDPFGLQLDLRASSKPKDRQYYSNAPVDSDYHLAYLKHLATMLSGGN